MPKMQKMEVGPCAFLWERSYKGLELAQLLGQLGVFLTHIAAPRPHLASLDWVSCDHIVAAPHYFKY
jgi:hypothetical protein